MQVQKGQRGKLESYLNVEQEIQVVMHTEGTAVYDYSCFGLDAQGKLSNDAYMVFYNQIQSSDGEISYEECNGGAKFTMQLQKLPEQIQKLSFTVSIDGAQNMGMINTHTVAVCQNGETILELSLNGADFHEETAIISLEFYRKDVWRFGVVADGFYGGLGDLLRNYGGEELEDNASSQEAERKEKLALESISEEKTAEKKSSEEKIPNKGTKLSLEKKLEQGAPKLISLVKPLQMELEKRNLLDCSARVALVLDISGSMSVRYGNGTVQEIVNKTLPLAVQFDNDGELDFWYYGTTCRRMPSVNMQNYEEAVPAEWKRLMRELGGRNNEVLVMEEIVQEYTGSKLPAYVLFISDGGVAKAGAIKKILKDASHEPIFWQFVGVGGKNYGILEKLDDMDGRYVDNANFFALDDFLQVSNEELYARLLTEFPQWLQEIKQKGMIAQVW